MEINKQITFLPTQDLIATTYFYKNILNFHLFLDQGDCIIFKTCENAYIGFCERLSTNLDGKIILTLIVDSVDDVYNELIKNFQIKINPPVTNLKYRIHHFFIEDPNGYLVEIQEFLDPVSW